MAGLKRFVGVLRLFGEAKSEWTVPDMAEALGLPASTVYRTVRELLAEGFLDPAPEARYRLGAAFVEFDRLVRLTDPLARLGEAPARRPRPPRPASPPSPCSPGSMATPSCASPPPPPARRR